MRPQASIPWLNSWQLHVVESVLAALYLVLLAVQPLSAQARLVSAAYMAPVVPKPAAAFDYDPITSLKANPTITGNATSTVPLRFVVFSKNGSVVYSDSSVLPAQNRFAETVYPPIANGKYTLAILAGTTTLATTTLTIGLRAEPDVEMDNSLASYDVADGHLMRFTIRAQTASGKVRAAVRGVAINQLTFAVTPSNADVEDVQLYVYTDPNFTDPSIASSTTAVNATPVEIDATTSEVTIVPDEPIEIPSGTTYYFDLVGTVTPSDTTYNVATTLLADTGAYAFGVFSDLASTTHFIWSPNTYGTSTLDAQNWTSGALAKGVSRDGLTQVRTNPPPTDAPTCNLTASTSTAPAGTAVTFSWSSTNADSAQWDDGSKEVGAGTKTYVQGTTTHTYILNFYNKYGFTNCYATVAEPYVFVATTTTVATSTATTTMADGFTASPTTGPISLAVTFKGSVNNANACAAQTYSLGYGDGATSTITVAKNLCKPLAFTLSHTYTKVGTFTAGLYSGTGTSSKQRIQTQVITPKAKVVGFFNGASNVASILLAFTNFLQWIKNTF